MDTDFKPEASPLSPGLTEGTPFARMRSPDETSTIGKRLRDTIPRKSFGIWKKPRDRVDPVAQLQASDPERLAELLPVRYGRMLVSPFTYYRGAAGVMAADLATRPVTGLRVQACGDCHLLNFGGFATPERHIIFDINDFDETLPAAWEWDVQRLVASFVLAARSNGLSDDDGRLAALTAARAYRKRLAAFARMSPLEVWYSRIDVEDYLNLVTDAGRKKAIRRRVEKTRKIGGSDLEFPRLAEVAGGQLHIRDAPPLIFHPDEERSPDFMANAESVLAGYRETLPDDRRVLLDRYRLADLAIKVVGIGSIGRVCWIGLFMSSNNDPLFLQIKEARASVLEPFAGTSTYSHHGQRVVVGQRMMQPASDVFLGWVTGDRGRQYYIRQLRDAKIKPGEEDVDAESLIIYGKACGWALARAHAKTGDSRMISGYLGNSDEFDIAMGSFAVAYADQAEADHGALKRAARSGKVQVLQEV